MTLLAGEYVPVIFCEGVSPVFHEASTEKLADHAAARMADDMQARPGRQGFSESSCVGEGGLGQGGMLEAIDVVLEGIEQCLALDGALVLPKVAEAPLG